MSASFLWGKDRLVLIRAEMDYRINGTLEYLACLVKHISKLFQDVTAYFQRILQQADGLVSLFHSTAYGKAYTMLLTINLRLKLVYDLVPFPLRVNGSAPKPCHVPFRLSVFCGQCLCPFLRLVLYGFGKGFLHALVLGFQPGVFLFDCCGLADPDKIADTVQYAVHFRLALIF